MSNSCTYHKNCADGFGAALAVKQYFDAKGQSCEFHPAQYGDLAPDVINKDVLIVDFSYKRDVLLELTKGAKSVQVIDHHKSAQQDLDGLDFCIFDMSKSGAVLTWQTLLPQRPLPLLLEYIQDRDLWQWQLPDSKAVSAALLTLEKSFELWQPYLIDENIKQLIVKGNAIVEYQNQQIAKVPTGEKLPMAKIAGYTVPCINTTHLISEIGDKISQGHPFAAMYFEKEAKRIYSLRSAKDGIDVSKIAEQYGGGGHFHAAGFAVDIPKIEI